MAGLDALSNDLWPSFVEKVQDIIRSGLEGLAADAAAGSLAGLCENDLNRQLFFRMRRIAATRHKALLSLTPRPTLSREHMWNLNPTLEANNQPSPDDIERTPRENKRPDFQWSVQDDEAVDLDRATRTYVVECKRLGHTVGSWVFNTNYVDHGVRRYVESARLYGKDDVGGAMIGYVQSMDIATIWTEVDRQIMSAGLAALPQLTPVPGSQILHFASHYLSRMNAVSPFHLHHVWVDLRVQG
jgi:hypothetical protein